MTRKHFEAIAAAVRDTPMEASARRELASNLASVCRGVNDRFDRQRFLTACGVS